MTREELEELFASHVSELFARLGVDDMTELWATRDIGITTIGELIEVNPDDEILSQNLGVQSMVHRARLLKFIKRTQVEDAKAF